MIAAEERGGLGVSARRPYSPRAPGVYWAHSRTRKTDTVLDSLRKLRGLIISLFGQNVPDADAWEGIAPERMTPRQRRLHRCSLDSALGRAAQLPGAAAGLWLGGARRQSRQRALRQRADCPAAETGRQRGYGGAAAGGGHRRECHGAAAAVGGAAGAGVVVGGRRLAGHGAECGGAAGLRIRAGAFWRLRRCWRRAYCRWGTGAPIASTRSCSRNFAGGCAARAASPSSPFS